MNKAFTEEVKNRMEKRAFNPFSRKPPLHKSLPGFAAKGALIAAGALGTEMIAEGVVDWWRERRKEKERGPLFEKIIEKHPELKKDEKLSSNMNYMGLKYTDWVSLNQGLEIELDIIPDKIKDKIQENKKKDK